MAVAGYLVDNSVFARQAKPVVAARLGPLSQQGKLALCGIGILEMQVSARNQQDLEFLRRSFNTFERLTTPDDVWDRAIEVQVELVERSLHRSVKIPDLLVAATAERHRVTVLHYDKDFDRIADVTGQPMEWVVPAGEAD
ncbi:PIN domain nuclease [Glycomyces buryatensis]|uniref:Ribonuclease VapC n=1 Tax=Glycomyces buryatensis TaxID=2570927 RepID=A0A4S8Q311_9ACTN|nr:PIN domain nuclease [Glycomyces buryatensis]THV38587.1 PIN domain nuclease [Glycomyces buryatensis]